MFRTFAYSLLFVLVLFACRSAYADTAAAISETYTYSGLPGGGELAPYELHGFLGGGWFRGDRIVGDPRRRTVLLPAVLLSYQDWLYWNITGGGVWLLRAEEWPLQFGAGVKVHPGYSPNDDPDLAGMEKRKSSIDGYVNALWKTELVNFGAAYYHDIGDVTHGDAATIRLSHHIKIMPKLTLTPSGGLEYVSTRLVSYYYGVTPAEALPERPAYTGHHAFNYGAGASAVYRINPSWSLLGGFYATHLGNGISDSPIVLKRHTKLSFFGAGWTF